MSVGDLLDELEVLDVKLWREGEALKFDAPAGALDTQMRDRIREMKPDLLRFLANPDGDASGLSLGQKRIWFHEKILANGCSYQIPGAMRIKGPLDVPALEKAIAEVIKNHDALRLSIGEKDGKPVANYCSEVPFALTVEKVDGLNAGSLDFKHALEEFLAEPFRMEVAPLIKCRVYRQDDRNHVLAISLHHTISDGWSVALFVDQLVDAYQDLYIGKVPALSAVGPGYREYVKESNVFLHTRKKTFDDFWKSYLHGAPLQFDFPSDRVRPPVENDAGNEVSLPLDPDLMRRLSFLAGESGCTLFTLLLGGFATLLHRLTGQCDLVIGTAHAGRNDPACHSVIGLFANTFPIRCKPDADTTFHDFLLETKEQTLQAMECSDTPFDWIVNAVNPPRDLSRPPVYQVMFNFLNHPKANPIFPDCDLEMMPLENTSSKVDLTLAVEERDGEYRAGIEYKTELFDEERMCSLLGHYTVLLESIASDPHSRLSSLELMSLSERETSLVDWNNTSKDFDRSKTLDSILSREAVPDNAVAFVYNSAALSYGELRSQSNRIALQLTQLGVCSEMIVAVMLERGLEYPAAVFGILRSGGAFLPIAPDCPLERLEFILADSGADILVISREMDLECGNLQPRLLYIEDLLDQSRPTPNYSVHEASPDSLAYCVYTSGTTGNPKGVEITHAAVVNLLNALTAHPGLPPDCSMLGIAPFYFDMSIPDVFMPVYSGGKGIILDELESRSPQKLNAIAAQCKNPVMQATASTLRMLLAQDWEIPSHMRIWCGGESFPADLAEQLLGKCVDLVNIYGPTEATVWSTAKHVTKVDKPLPVGGPLQNNRVYVLDEQLCPLPVGYSGQLHIAGDGLARGYRNNTDLTDEKFVTHSLPCIGEERLYATGDLARWRYDGNLEILGRIDSQLKILGHRIEPEEIESVLMSCDPIEEAAVTAVKDSSGELQLAAFVVCNQFVDQENIRSELRNKLPPYMEPRWICEIETLPRSANGKLNRNALPSPSMGTKAPDHDEGLLSGVEKRMHDLWVKVLQQDKLGREQNFFEVGGHSLLAVHLLSEVNKVFGSRVPIITFLQDPTIAGICRSISQIDTVGPRLVGLSKSKSKSSLPLVLVPGASGNPYSYQAIAKQLLPNVHLVGIAPTDTDDGSMLKIEEVAAECVDLLKGNLSGSPYQLVGHSYGGVVVFEMARQLLAAGDPVANLLIIDLPAKPYLKTGVGVDDAGLLAEIAEAAQVFSGIEMDKKTDFSGLGSGEAKLLLLSVLEKSGMIPSQDDTSLCDALLMRYRNSRVAMQNYFPGKINVPIHVIRCAESDFDPALPDSLGWDKFTDEGVTTVTVPGSHISMITGSNAIALAAEILKIVKPSI